MVSKEKSDVEFGDNDKDKEQITQPEISSTHAYNVFTYGYYIVVAAIGLSLAATVCLAIAAIWNHLSRAKDQDVVFPGSEYQRAQPPHVLIPRAQWGADDPLLQLDNLTLPVEVVIITHSSTPYCYSTYGCSKLLEASQKYDLEEGRLDIAENFYIGGDGNIYVGRGWDFGNERRNDSISVSFIGNFLYDELWPTMLEALMQFLDGGLESGKLGGDYKIVCDNQTRETLSPGENVYKVVKELDYFQEGQLY